MSAPRSLSFANPALVLIGLSGGVYLNLGGRLAIGELISVGLALTLLSTRLFRAHISRRLLLGLLIMLAGLAVGSLLVPATAGAVVLVSANYAVLAVAAIVVFELLKAGDDRSIVFLLGSVGIGQLLGVFLTPTATAFIDPWKFGVGAGVSLITLLMLDIVGRRASFRVIVTIFALALAAYSLSVGSRLLAVFVVVAVVASASWFSRLLSTSRLSAFLAVASLAGLIVCAVWLYEDLASRGVLGTSVSQKYLNQIGEWGIIPGARKELVVLLGAWIASPVFGWGASASVPQDVRLASLGWFEEFGYQMDHSSYMNLFGSSDTPLHSVLLGALIQAGIFSIPLMVVIASALLRGVFFIRQAGVPRASSFVIVAAFFHLLTSPLGDITRMPIAVGLGVAFFLVQQKQERESLGGLGVREKMTTG